MQCPMGHNFGGVSLGLLGGAGQATPLTWVKPGRLRASAKRSLATIYQSQSATEIPFPRLIPIETLFGSSCDENKQVKLLTL